MVTKSFLVTAIGLSIVIASINYFPSFNRPINSISFSLLNQNSERVSSTSLRGHWLMVYFGFTHCPDICPTELKIMTITMQELEEIGWTDSIVPVFISVDPGRDTPDRLKNYLGHFHRRFIGLTGTDAEIAHAVASFNAYYRTVKKSSADKSYAVGHSSVVYVVDPNGAIVAQLPYGQGTTARARIIHRLLSTPAEP